MIAVPCLTLSPRQPCTGLRVVTDGVPISSSLNQPTCSVLPRTLPSRHSSFYILSSYICPENATHPDMNQFLDLLLSTSFLPLCPKPSLLFCCTKPHRLMAASFLLGSLHLLGQVVPTAPPPLNFHASVKSEPHTSLLSWPHPLSSLYLNSNTSPQFLSLAGAPSHLGPALQS